LIFLCFSCLQAHSQAPADASITENPVIQQSDGNYTIGGITIIGNKKTKDHIILREIPFKKGETYTLQVLVKKFEDARKQLYNTALFHTVLVAADHFDGNTVFVNIEVKERWYLFPLPFFKPVDRNINQWVVEQKASMDRVNYGIRVEYNNATGRNDKFRLWLVNGYTRQFSASYEKPYFDKQMKWGFSTGFGFGKNREVNYNTIDDKQVFIKDNNHYIRSFAGVNAQVSYRRAIKTKHIFGVAYNVEDVSDTIVSLNPNYFKRGHSRIRVPAVYYNLNYFDLDYNPYPTRGYALQLALSKSGFDKVTNLWQMHVKALGSWHLSPLSFFSVAAYAGVKLPFHQPYFNSRFLGYNDVFLQGYEYYVIDGVAGGYLKATLARKFLDLSMKLPGGKKKNKEPERIPFKLYGKIYGNTGYVHNPQPGENLLSNKMLYTGGLGIDIVTFYDITFKFEWTFNQLGQNGLFLHRKTIF
jgi:hypothetical protein